MQFRIGCAIWAYKEWVGELYPPKSRAGDFLRLYGQRFTTVEGNTTFYSTPDAETVKRWATETPAEFQFCLKLPREVTHRGALLPNLGGAIAFLQKMRSLHTRLGPLFAQLPPSYSPEQFEDLVAFLKSWPFDEAELAVEVRHSEWFGEPHETRLNELLQELTAGRVLLDTRPIYECPENPELDVERRKPRVPVQPIVTTDYAIARFISHPEPQWNAQWMTEWVPIVDGWLRQGKRVYWFVHCPVEVRSPANARHFQQLLEQYNAPVPPLPWNEIPAEEPDSSQLSLF